MNNFKFTKYIKKITLKRVVENNSIYLDKKYRFVVVIPVYCEFVNVGKTLNSLSKNESNYLNDTAVILVVNNPVNLTDILDTQAARVLNNSLNCLDVKQTCRLPKTTISSVYFDDNQLLLSELRNGSYQTKYDLKELNLMWIDASSTNKGLPGKGGVGMARKLGMDCGIAFLDWKNDPLIISLDADTLVEYNYLKAISDYFNINQHISGATVDFCHMKAETDAEERAIREYEYFIKYYTDGLKKAGSPYAYHSIGSAIVCRAVAYIKIGGMNLHRGGEDFYFMQALRKLGEIGEINKTKVYPSARISARVPFGTGPRIQQSIDGKRIQLYNPKIFEVLKETLLNVKNWIESESVTNTTVLLNMLLPEANIFFVSLDFDIKWPKILKNNVKKIDSLSNDDRMSLLSAFHTWFDAFRVLKFIHHLERNYSTKYPKVDIDKITDTIS